MGRSRKNQPPIERRPVLVKFVRMQRCRYNPSFAGFDAMPEPIQLEMLDKWQLRHPRENFELLGAVSMPPVGRKRGTRG